MTRRALALAAVLLAVAPAAAPAKRVRLFAVGPKFELSWVDTRAHFHDKLIALVDATKRGAGAPAIQDGADDMASHRLGPADPAQASATARDLVTLPEDIGLMAAFVGERGRGARAAADLTTSIASLIVSYATVNGYYQSKYPALGNRPFPPTRLLGVALTDTFARVAVETFAEIADRYDVWLEAGVNMVREWQVVCVSKASMPKLPGGVQCDVEDPARVVALRAPDEPERTYAYEATTPDVMNMGLVFDPDGKLRFKQPKAYLTPTELPGQLDLKPGDVSGVVAISTSVGRIGIVTSKDAWMPDVTTRLDQGHVQVLVQPEFFVNDTVRTTGPWAPDNIKGSGWSDVMRHPSMEAMVLPELTGNLFDFSADNQQQIVVKPRSVRHAPSGALVGQPRAPGFAVVGRWVVPDPQAAAEPMAARRERLGKAGEAMLPAGAPCPDPRKAGPCRGGQVEDVVFADVQVDAPRGHRRQPLRRAVPPFTRNRPIAPSEYPQRNASLAGRGRTVVAAFEERRGERDVVLVARSPTNGANWHAPIRPAPGTANQWWPSLSVGSDGVWWLAWQDDSSGTWRVYYARSRDAGRRWSAPVAVDAQAPAKAGQWRPSIAATGRNTAFVAWIDERARFSADDVQQAALYGSVLEGDKALAASRLDAAGPTAPLAATLDHSWWPSVAARGRRTVVSWTDFRTYDWRIYQRLSADGGRTFADESAVGDVPAETESLADRPQAVVLRGGGPLIAWTHWAKTDNWREPLRLHDTLVGAPGAKSFQADGHGAEHTSTFSPALLALPDGGAVVAWQDHARGPGDIRAARVTATGAGKPYRVDDSGDAGWNQWRPALGLTSARVVVAWEDERDGPANIFVARAKPSRIR